MDKNLKIKRAINMETIEEVPFSFWTHLPEVDLDPVRLAEETYEFYKKYDIDFIKTMNNGMYPIEDYGCEIDYSEIEKGGVAKLIKTPIEGPEDWDKIRKIDPNTGALKRELESLKLLSEKVKKEAPIVFTIFSSLTIAVKLSRGKVLEHIELGYEKEVHRALEVITQTTIDLVKAAKEYEIAGVFFANQMASYDKTNENVYLEYGVPYDLKVLESADDLWFNIIHAHGENIMFDIIKDYPVDVFNWHAWETLPDVDEAKDLSGKCLMGGIKRMDITNKEKNNLTNQIYRSLKATGKKGLILTPGCVVRYPLDEDIFKFIRHKKIEVEKNL